MKNTIQTSKLIKLIEKNLNLKLIITIICVCFSITFWSICATAEEYRLLIITPEEFSGVLQPLVEHKNRTSMPTLLLTLEDITQRGLYASGYDIQEKIKLAISISEQEFGIDYVMLVGDVDRFPVRYTRIWDADNWGHSFAPSDLYYSDLYNKFGNFDYWDNDNDNYFGEMDGGSPANWSELNQDQINLEPDVAVGRIPASSIAEVETMVNKIIDYELMEEILWTKKLLFFCGNFYDPTAEIDYITHALFDYSFTVYDESTTAGYAFRENLINSEMDAGQGFIVYFGHGAGGRTGNTGGDGGKWDGWYQYTAFANASNALRLPIMLAAACDTAMFNFPHNPYLAKNGGIYLPIPNLPQNQQDAWEPAALQPSIYDLDTMAEHALVKHTSGAIAYVGAYTGIQEKAYKIVRRFFEELETQGGCGILGDIWVGGIKRYINLDFPDINNYWNKWNSAAIYHHIQKMMLFGDPSLRIGGIHTFAYQVSAGSSNDLDRYRSPYHYYLPSGYTPDDIVGMGIDGTNNYNFVWFRDGMVSAGSSDDLDKYRSLYTYTLPNGYTPDDIVGMGIDETNNYNFVWFRDGMVSAGSSDDLDKYRSLYTYTLPNGYTPDDIVGMGIDGKTNNYNFVWFSK